MPQHPPAMPAAAPRPKRRPKRAALTAYGEPLVWLTGGALVISLVMIVGLLALVVWQGAVTFWPRPVTTLETYDGTVYMGEITRDEWQDPAPGWKGELDKLPAQAGEQALAALKENDGKLQNELVRIGNYELTNTHFAWVAGFEVKERTYDPWAVVVERLEWGRFYGFPEAYAYLHPVEAGEEAEQRHEAPEAQRQAARAEARAMTATLATDDGASLEFLVERFVGRHKDQLLIAPQEVEDEDTVLAVAEVWRGREAAWAQFTEHHEAVRDLWRDGRSLEEHEVGEVNRVIEEARLELKEAELDYQPPKAWVTQYAAVKQAREQLQATKRDARRFVAAVREAYGAGSERLAEARKEAAGGVESSEQRLAEANAKLEEIEKVWGRPSAEYLDVLKQTEEREREANAEFQRIMARIAELDAQADRHQLEFSTARNHTKLLGLAEIVRAYRANQLDTGDRWGVYVSRWWEFLTDDPREANSEGGVWPAIVGTITMTLLMSLAVVPFGVLAALYLREYAKAGVVVSVVRISINNLAGVPSIVIGVFGLGFFCYLVGAYVDGGPKNVQVTPWPPLRWWLFLGGAVVIGVAAFFVSLLSGVRARSAKRQTRPMLKWLGIALWLTMTVVVVLLIVYSPYFKGLYRAKLADNRPTFGTDGLLWASLTLALLTAPVVIVATEEALSAVPNSMREGSYACGASKWQTVRRIVLPRAMPGIMTGMVLAIARGAGEVAPLMLVGAEKLAPALPVDGTFPFVHLDRTFMHLGFHIYDLGFQSPNAEAAKPMVFSTTLLLITIVAALNLAAVVLRTRLRKKFITAQF
jgi:ABC-type phosphate transport system permease subunit/ABC-type phosphate transport system auxiliary subunit